MLDIKTWLEAAGEPVQETNFLPGEAPNMPYIIYLDSIQREGGDTINLLNIHSVTVERYSDIDDDNSSLDALLDEKALTYTKEKSWLSSEECYMTVYEFTIIKKERR